MIDFYAVSDAIATVSCTGATSAKEQLLKKYAVLPGFTQILKFIYDPYFKTGIKQNKLCRYGVAANAQSPEEMMDYLRTNGTGTSWDVECANAFIEQYADDPNAEWLAEGLVTKDLQIGVSITTLNKVYGTGFIPKIGIMRGMLCPEDATGTYIATEKIDGNRRLIMNKETGVEIYTRSGRRDTGLIELEKEAAAVLPKGYVFDCECIASGAFTDSIALRQASASILNRRNQKRTGVRALCFDVLTQEEYDKGISRLGALARKTMAASMTGDYSSCEYLQQFAHSLDEANGRRTNYANSVNALTGLYRNAYVHDLIIALPILGIAHNKEEGIAIAEPIWESGGEGVMLVDWKSAYEVNPNPRKTLLKIKMLKEYECKCISVYAGDNKYAGVLGGIIVAYVKDGTTYSVGVGSGFTDAMRLHYWKHPEDIIGKVVELDSFGESVNAQGGYSLNCPIFKRVKGDRE